MNLLASHLRQLRHPEVVPERIVSSIRNARIKPHLLQIPVLLLTNRVGQSADIVIRIFITESVPRSVEKILPVNEDRCPFDCGFGWHSGEEITPPEAVAGVSNGE